jgi:hypothetical protein
VGKNMSKSVGAARPSPWFFWWKIAPAELERQVREYASLKFYQSGRGQSAVALLVIIIISAVTVVMGAQPAFGVIVESLVFIGLAIFIWFGHRWASIAAMTIWTVEKLYDFIAASQGKGSSLIPIAIWWIIFMRFFYLAFRVEQARRKAKPSYAEVFD